VRAGGGMMVDSAPRLLWQAQAREMIGVDWIEAEIAPVSVFGRRCRAGERLHRPGDERIAHEAIARVFEAARRISQRTLAALRRALTDAPDPRGIIARVDAGEIVNDVDFFELSRFLRAVLEIRELATDALFTEIAVLPDPSVLWTVLAPGCGSARSFYLDDVFDEELALARADAAWRRIASDAARSRLLERVARYAGIEQVRAGEFILLRERIHGPLPPNLRVLREAPTYLLCDVPLDEEALAALTVLDAVNRSVADHEERVRARLSAEVRANVPLLTAAVTAFGALDSFIARVYFAQTHETHLPEILEEPSLCFEEARYLPLQALLAERGQAYVPISLELQGVGVITGSNMGGKTAALRTCGFLAACVAFGVPVPARRARLALFEEIAWLGTGVGQQPLSLLSGFGAEIVEVRALWERGPSRTLLLIDEFARTTTPREGRALLSAFLERLRACDACVLVTTHLEHIAADASAVHYAPVGLRKTFSAGAQPLDLQSALAAIAGAMDYRIVRVGEQTMHAADALLLAQVLGLDPSILESARKRL
jgi:DNA mismatch repair protein MutS2